MFGENVVTRGSDIHIPATQEDDPGKIVRGYLEQFGGMEERALPDWYCTSCGAHWSAGVYLDNCYECGGGAMARDCFDCGAKCGEKFVRSPLDSQDFPTAHWIGSCGLQESDHHRET